MPTKLLRSLANDKILHVFVWTWTALVVSADLKITLFPQIHWVATLVLLLPVYIARRPSIIHFRSWVVIFGALYISSGLLTLVHASSPLYDLAELLKLLVILIWAYPLFKANVEYAYTAVKAFNTACIINCVLLIVGFLFLPSVAHDLGAGRWGTILNYPGSLGRLGVLVFSYALYNTLRLHKPTYNIVVLTSSLILIFTDGSRTATLSGLLAGVFIIGVLIFNDSVRPLRTYMIRFMLPISAVLMAGGFTYVITNYHTASSMITESIAQGPAIHQHVSSHTSGGVSVGVTRLQQTISNASLSGVQNADPDRYKLDVFALHQIESHPIIGTGIGSTQLALPGGAQKIHNAYLQAWADIGILGVFSLLGLVLGWSKSITRVLRSIRTSDSGVETRAAQYSAVFLLIFYAASLLVHPLSTEWSEWVEYLIPMAIYANVVRDGAEFKVDAI